MSIGSSFSQGYARPIEGFCAADPWCHLYILNECIILNIKKNNFQTLKNNLKSEVTYLYWNGKVFLFNVEKYRIG